MLAFKKEESEEKALKREIKKQEKNKTMKKEEEQEEEGEGVRLMKTKKGRGRKEKPVEKAALGSTNRVKKERDDAVRVKEEEREEVIVGGNGAGNGLAPGTPVAVLEEMVKKEVKERKVLVVKTEVVEASIISPAEPSRRAAAMRSRGKE
eukprot:evm.model.NODE_43600_length_19835_cov_35.750946.1